MDEALRTEVHGLLERAADAKALRGGMSIPHLESAYRMASRLEGPWLPLCAYRLAHVLMREEKPDLQRVDELLTEAGKAGCLGPWPQLYRVAVVARLQKDRAQAALGRAAEAVRRWRRPPPDSDDANTFEEPRLQDDVFNMLELATYFVGAKYEALEGLGESREPREGDYRVVTENPETAQIACTLDFALEEQEVRAQGDPEAILLRLLEGGPSRWKLPDRDWERVDHRKVRLLAALGTHLVKSEDDLVRYVCGEREDRKAAQDQKRQIKLQIARKLGREPVIPQDGISRLAVRIVAVVHWPSLAAPPAE